jgi:hypothetical protein
MIRNLNQNPPNNDDSMPIEMRLMGTPEDEREIGLVPGFSSREHDFCVG